jgi:hypothetical protein
MFIKPYFWSETTSDDELDKLEAPLSTSELTLELTKPAEPSIPPTIKRGRGCP